MPREHPITWETRNRPISEEAVAKVEACWRIRFPDDYRALVLAFDEGTPDTDVFHLPDGDRVLFSNLFSLNPESSFNILHAWVSRFEYLPARIFPFADDGGGNFYCFDYRETDENPPVVFLFHDPMDEPIPAAASFAELLDRLEADSNFDEDNDDNEDNIEL